MAAGLGLVERLRYARYLWVQVRQTRAKRGKDARFRLVPFAGLVKAHCPELAPGDPVLCIGPRNEIELDVLAEAGLANVTAIDLYAVSSRIRRMDMHRLRFPDAGFALVFASHVFEHAWDFDRVAREVLRVLRPGGYVFCSVPRGFTPSAHDRYCFDGAADLLAYFRVRRPRVLYEAVRPQELTLLFQVDRG